jgi:hypothetical protein
MQAMCVKRQTVDLSAYPDLIVIYLGMRVHSLRGLLRLAKLGPQIRQSWQQRPRGSAAARGPDLLAFSAACGHAAVLARLRLSGGLGARRPASQVVAVYDGDLGALGLASFAPIVPAKGPLFGARSRLYPGEATPPASLPEDLCEDQRGAASDGP